MTKGAKNTATLRQNGAAEIGTFPGRTHGERTTFRKDRFEPSPQPTFDLAFRQISTSDKAKPTAPRLHPYAPRLPEASALARQASLGGPFFGLGYT